MPENHELLKQFDEFRGQPDEGLDTLKEWSPDRTECRIVKLANNIKNIPAVIAEEKKIAQINNVKLEWKVYSHDSLPGIKEDLVSAGFVAEDEETVMFFPVEKEFSADLKTIKQDHSIKIVHINRPSDLEKVAEISKQIGRKNFDSEKKQFAKILTDNPESLEIFVLLCNDDPASCGRIYYPEKSPFAELAGGRTKSHYRNQGFFTLLVQHRIKQARLRKRTHIFVDALPTSQPALSKLGFQVLTKTQPFMFDPQKG